jgi:PhnB protein
MVKEASMTQIPPAGMSQVIPYLFYADLPQAVAWLERAFGFERIAIHPTGNGRHHGEMRYGTGMIMMGTAAAQFATETPHAAKARTHGTFIYLDAVDEHYARAKAAGAEIVDPPKDEGYGRTYWARDLDGHDWFFTRPPA